MYDRIKVEYAYDKPELLRDTLESIKIDPDHDDNVMGYHNGFRVRYGNGLLHLSGSLTKYAMPDELGNPSLDTLKHAYTILKRKLFIPDDAEGIVRYLEVGWTLSVERPVLEYLSFLRPVGRYQYSSVNMNNGNGVYHANENRVIAVYDKIAERKKKRDDVYKRYQGMHMLRVEARFKRSVNAWLKSFFGRDTVAMEELFRPEYGEALTQYVQREIEYILPEITSDSSDEWSTPGELIRILAGKAVELDGGVEVAAGRIDLQRRTGRIRARVARDAKKAVYNAFDKYRSIERTDLRDEVLRSIRSVVQNSISGR